MGSAAGMSITAQFQLKHKLDTLTIYCTYYILSILRHMLRVLLSPSQIAVSSCGRLLCLSETRDTTCPEISCPEAVSHLKRRMSNFMRSHGDHSGGEQFRDADDMMDSDLESECGSNSANEVNGEPLQNSLSDISGREQQIKKRRQLFKSEYETEYCKKYPEFQQKVHISGRWHRLQFFELGNTDEGDFEKSGVNNEGNTAKSALGSDQRLADTDYHLLYQIDFPHEDDIVCMFHFRSCDVSLLKGVCLLILCSA